MNNDNHLNNIEDKQNFVDNTDIANNNESYKHMSFSNE